MIDDAISNFINAAMRGGNQKFRYTGPTYKGNAMSPELEANFVYNDDAQEAYNDTIYKLEDADNQKKTMNETNEKTSLISFIRDLNIIDPTTTTDEANKGNLEKLVDPQHTMIHLAMSYLSSSWDSVWHQASNYYLTEDTNNNQWTLIWYDFDETFDTGTPSYTATTLYSNFSRPVSKRPLVETIINSPYYKTEFEKVLLTLVKRFFKASVITPRLDAWTQMLREDVECDLTIEPNSPGIKTQWTLRNFENNMKITDGENMGVAEWVETRSTSVQQHLNFNVVDDLPVTGPYQVQATWDANSYERMPLNEKNAEKGDQESSSGACINYNKSNIAATLVIAVFTCQIIMQTNSVL